MFKLREKTTELIILGIMYFAMMCYFYILLFGTGITFVDTDDFMRVVRIKEFFNHFDLNNHIIERSNYPHGCELHWSRLYDFFIITLTWIINFFEGSLEKSIEYACFCISPIVGLVSMVYIFKTFEFFVQKNNIFLAVALFCVSPFMMPIFSFGRPDHHSFITLCMIIYMYNVIKMVLREDTDKFAYIKVAIAAAACVWASPETLIVLLLTDAALFFAYINDFEQIEGLYFKSLITSCFIGMIAMIPEGSSRSFHSLSICLLLMLIPYTTLSAESLKRDVFFKYWHYVCLLFMMIFIGEIYPVAYDKISIVHVALYLCLSTFFAVNLQLIGRKSRIYDALIWAMVIALIFLSMFPRFLMGMSADVPNFVKEIWLSKIAELQSPFAGRMSLTFSIYSLVTITAVCVKIRELMTQKFARENIIWGIFSVIALCYLILACFAYRMIPYSVLFGMPLVVNLGMSSQYVKNFSRPLRLIITMTISFFFIFITACFDNSDDDSTKSKEIEVFSYLDNLSYDPVVIMAHSNYGPKLLYYTKHRVLGAPYHRQIDGIIFSYAVMEMDCDMKIVRRALKKSDAQYIFIKNNQKDEYPNSFASKILEGEYPRWISFLETSQKFPGYTIVKINQDMLIQEMEDFGESERKNAQ